jgi:transposase
MDRESLRLLLAQGLSLAEMGRRFGRHESTIAYWVQKHGLQAANHDKHAARGGLTREELEPLVEAGMTTREIAAVLDRGQASVRHWLKKYELATNPTVRRERRRAARSASTETIMETCSRHDVAEHYLDNLGYYRCKRCRAEAVVRRRRKVKEILVSEWGGRCAVCGYDSYSGALQFHHLNPADKSFGLSMRGLGRSIADLRAEAQKCVLLCSNCHAEVEAGRSSVPA